MKMRFALPARRIGCASLAAILCWSPNGYVEAGPATAPQIAHPQIIIPGGDPLPQALNILGDQLGCCITYEDPDYQSPDSLVELIPGGQKAAPPRRLVFSYEWQRDADALAIVQAMLDEYARIDPTAQFKVTRSSVLPTLLHVFPNRTADKTGTLVRFASVLDTHISISEKDTYQQVATRVCKAVSTNQPKPDLGMDNPPTAEFHSETVTLEIKDRPALEALDRLIAAYQSAHKEKLFWRLIRLPEHDLAELVVGVLRERPIQLDTVTVCVAGRRPLEEAVREAGQRLGKGIIYEDPEYVADVDIMRDKDGKPQAPWGGGFMFAFTTSESFSEMIERSIKNYNSRGPGYFGSKAVGNSTYVFPTRVRDRNREFQDVKQTVLAAHVTLSLQDKPATEAVAALCRALGAAAGRDVQPGKRTAWGMRPRAHVTYAATDKPAAECLDELSQMLGGVAWQLLYDVRTQNYVLESAPISGPRSVP